MTALQLSRIQELLRGCSKGERYEVFRALRQEFPIHEIELRWNAPAEVILEAIARSPDLTLRGVRGVIADAAFGSYVLPEIEQHGWANVSPVGNFSYDYAVSDGKGQVRVQVKMQRMRNHRPMMANEGYRRFRRTNLSWRHSGREEGGMPLPVRTRDHISMASSIYWQYQCILPRIGGTGLCLRWQIGFFQLKHLTRF